MQINSSEHPVSIQSPEIEVTERVYLYSEYNTGSSFSGASDAPDRQRGRAAAGAALWGITGTDRGARGRPDDSHSIRYDRTRMHGTQGDETWDGMASPQSQDSG